MKFIVVTQLSNMVVSARAERYASRLVSRIKASRVAAFQKICKSKARTYPTMGFHALLNDPERLISAIFDACNKDLGHMMCIISDSIHNFKTPEDLLRTAITVQQTREDAPVSFERGNAVLQTLITWSKLMKTAKYWLKTSEQCIEFSQKFKAWSLSLFRYTHGCRRLRFIAVSRRKHEMGNNNGDETDFEKQYK